MNKRSLLIRAGLFTGLVWLAWAGWKRVEGSEGMMLAYVLAVGAAAGFLAVRYVLPLLGDIIGNFVFSSGEKITSDENYKALSLAAQGDYEGALAEYERLLGVKPTNSMYVWEMARLCAERLHQPDRAIRLLHKHLESRPWSPDEDAFLRSRLAGLYQEHRQDFSAARAVLEDLIRRHPQTRHSANATHQLADLDHAQQKHLASFQPPPTK